MNLFLMIVFAVCVFALIAGISHTYNKKRREAFTKIAEQLGLEIHFKLPQEDWDRIERFDLYKSKSRKHTVGLAFVAQTDSTRITVCEYNIVVNASDDSSVVPSIVLLVWDPRLDAPALSLQQKTWNASLSASVSKWFGYQVIEFPEDPEFQSRYLVRGESEEALKAFLTADRREGLIRHSVPNFEACGDCMIVVHHHLQLQPPKIQDRFAEALNVLNSLV
jgi:hypothetical protein